MEWPSILVERGINILFGDLMNFSDYQAKERGMSGEKTNLLFVGTSMETRDDSRCWSSP